MQRVRVGIDRLLKESVEEQSAAACGAPIEPEGELVEVVGAIGAWRRRSAWSR